MGTFTIQWLLQVILVPLIFGNYVFTWLTGSSLRKEIRFLKDNHLHEIQDRLKEVDLLREQVKALERKSSSSI